ncbi:MAG: biopolymer transporter ExbD [Candidatus Muirbacterium halophilum]|nr:biopolymer transporter ExbD [Candidatus Muirbacterium halophilum]MCK9477591.1 biopolymer transporter ExbD [Candidatus Muirbacterium halophilum]
MDRLKKRRRNISLSIESVAMTDVVFLLLIFFMLSTTFVTLDAGIKIDLPQGGIKNLDVQEELKLKITKNGDIFYHGRMINENFDKVISVAIEESTTKTVIISGDKNTVHGDIVHIMSSVLKLGAKSIAIATNPEEESQIEEI